MEKGRAYAFEFADAINDSTHRYIWSCSSDNDYPLDPDFVDRMYAKARPDFLLLVTIFDLFLVEI